MLGFLEDLSISGSLEDVSEGVSEVGQVVMSLVEEEEFRLGLSLSLL